MGVPRCWLAASWLIPRMDMQSLPILSRSMDERRWWMLIVNHLVSRKVWLFGHLFRTQALPTTRMCGRQPCLLPPRAKDWLLDAIFDALVTSSIRLDVRGQSSVGAATGNFQLMNEAESTASRIFLDKESLDLGVALCQDRKAYRITNSHLHCQLRRLKTKFYDSSTFFLCRATGPLTKAHSFQPCTIFTFCNHSQLGDGHHASRLFFKLGTAVLQTGNDAVLEVDTVRECRQSCSNETRSVPLVIDSILGLFKNGTSTIPILGNRQLNGYLETLTIILSSYISGANNTMLTATLQSLEA